MSGIVGIVNLDGAPVDRRLLRLMTDSLSSRGPDAQEVWSDGPVGFGHTMLRTTRESLGEQQPFSLDGEVWITADARIDGRDELIRKLRVERSEGEIDAAAAPDVELIWRSYQAWGERCVWHLLGDFSFAIWDGRRKRLFCARDRFGVKPLYFAKVGRCVAFSNALNTLRLHPQVTDKINSLAIADFLLFGFSQDPAATIFTDVQRLPAAHHLSLSDGALRLERYWGLPTDGHVRYRRSSEYVEHFAQLFDTAVRDRLRADRVGVLMSGGLDSSAVAAAARTSSREGSAVDLRAYTVVYDRLIPDSERHYSGLVAEALNIPIDYLAADDYQLFERHEQPELHYPEPYDEPLGAVYLDQMQQVAAHTRVALTGQGGDPLLCLPQAWLTGALKKKQLARFAAGLAQHVAAYRSLPRPGFRRALKRRLGKRVEEWRPTYPRWLNPAFERQHNLRERWEVFNVKPPPAHASRPDAYNNLSSHWWPLMFEQYDASWVSCPVEIRHPFFDSRLVEFALAIPPAPWCLNKTLLRAAMRCKLPEPVRLRPKTPVLADPVRVRLSGPDSQSLMPIRTREVEEYLDAETAADIRRGIVGKDCATMDGLRPYYLARWLEQEKRSRERHNLGGR